MIEYVIIVHTLITFVTFSLLNSNKIFFDSLFLSERANMLHPNLQFTIEIEHKNELPFLDLLIKRDNGKLSSSWYSKPTDTGVTLNYHACAPTKYKRNIVEGAVHRIHHTTTSWAAFDRGVETLKTCLEAN